MRCLIIHNPSSGTHSDEIYAFCHALAQAGDELVVRLIGGGLEAPEATRDAGSFDRVVVSGGDGTVASVLDCLRGSGVPVMVFPSGTANLFFTNIGNAPDTAALAHTCREGKVAKADMGELFWEDEQGRPQRHGFTIIAGSGFDATIMQKAQPVKRDIGEVAYFLSALQTLEPQVAHFTIEHDGEVDEMDGISCMVGNTSVIQNGISLFPDCRMDDGLLDVAVIEPVGLVQLLPTVVASVIDPVGKGLGRPQFTMFQAHEVRVKCTPSLGMQYDGELVPSHTGVFGARALPGCVDLIVDAYANLQPAR